MVSSAVRNDAIVMRREACLIYERVTFCKGAVYPIRDRIISLNDYVSLYILISYARHNHSGISNMTASTENANPRHPRNRETSIPRYLAVQIQIEIVV